MRSRTTSRSQSKRPIKLNDPLASTISINQQYSQLLRQFTKIVFNPRKTSQKAYLFDTNSILRDINKCLQKQLVMYRGRAREQLEVFLKEKELWNTGNLIGKFEEIKSEMESCQKTIEDLDQQQSGEQQTIDDEINQLEQELNRLGSLRAGLVNRGEMIQQQLQLQNNRGAQNRKELLTQQLKLRKLETNR